MAGLGLQILNGVTQLATGTPAQLNAQSYNINTDKTKQQTQEDKGFYIAIGVMGFVVLVVILVILTISMRKSKKQGGTSE